ncbi:hypothetical protein GIB67_005457 [Kingdonia uniflora]|uniref:mRNA (guanine-N(7))-methyltransferase n=1 Tax=Kingdonia uniflora TaxID=39325 RepID=A0A7J7NHD5_9MAGN|nr:hypothetical protein GIB67_005457 [Kingdonia uniflora]
MKAEIADSVNNFHSHLYSTFLKFSSLWRYWGMKFESFHVSENLNHGFILPSLASMIWDWNFFWILVIGILQDITIAVVANPAYEPGPRFSRMKRGYDESASTSMGPPHSRRKLDPIGVSQFVEDNTSEIAEHYSARTNQSLQQREASPIIHLKRLNNWIKSVLVQLYARPGDAVLDLACGKGGDLIKWDKAKIGYYVGIDIAEGSIEDARQRYNGQDGHHKQPKRHSFPARLICGDCWEVRLDRALKDDAPFDVCSCQFAMHYSWSTEARTRRAFANISSLLRPGGTFIGTMPDANVLVKKLREAEGLFFGNSVFWIRFDEEFAHKKFKTSSPFGIKYQFHLEVGANLISFIVSFASCHSPVEAQGKLPEQKAMTAAAESDSIQATDQPFDVAHAAP